MTAIIYVFMYMCVYVCVSALVIVNKLLTPLIPRLNSSQGAAMPGNTDHVPVRQSGCNL